MTRRDNSERADSQVTAAPVRVPETVALDQTFSVDGLYALRAAVAAHATDLGLPSDRVEGLVIVATELATNSIRHGGGTGRLRLWDEDDELYCEVTDQGPGIVDPDVAGTRPVALTSDGGRGLWIVRQLCDRLYLRAAATGSTVTAVIRIEDASA
ncbi:ATP-binding protein [Micromonospora sp. NPDC049523]|uniref:ATP-binding protein n=1 Tax=Micromonospora sp. NPDC049523 TaxID=3155921 RepID=UPI003417F1FD